MKRRTQIGLKWELRWIPVEMAMVGCGLFLQIGRHLDEAGAFFLILAIVVSGPVRWMHYIHGGSRQGNHT